MRINIKNFLIFLLISSLYSSFIPELGATHISRPVLQESKTEYSLGEKVVLSGWADYKDQPTSDVLLNVRVFQSDGSEVMDKSLLSNEQGYFKFELETKDLLPGLYRIVVTSQCREAHRQICSYRSETLSIHLRK